jgi:hypothetical protein
MCRRARRDRTPGATDGTFFCPRKLAALITRSAASLFDIMSPTNTRLAPDAAYRQMATRETAKARRKALAHDNPDRGCFVSFVCERIRYTCVVL